MWGGCWKGRGGARFIAIFCTYIKKSQNKNVFKIYHDISSFDAKMNSK